MNIELLGTVFFAVALINTFIAHKLKNNRYLHHLSEVEIIFSIWAGVFILAHFFLAGHADTVNFLRHLSLFEPILIFTVMLIFSRPKIISMAGHLLVKVSFRLRFIKAELKTIQFFLIMTLGPLLGSLMTEPAAITVSSILLYSMLKKNGPRKLFYRVLAVLFVNVSIGGALSNFAAPPILLVAHKWNWSSLDVIIKLGIPATIAILINAVALIRLNRTELSANLNELSGCRFNHLPGLRNAVWVAMFLTSLIIFGGFQRWWLEPLVTGMSDKILFIGATLLTAFVDNAALTYLGSQVESLSEVSRWALAAGALTGGGLSIIANAPNLAGFSILKDLQQDNTLDSWLLVKAAIVPTFVAFSCFAYILF